MIGKQIAHYRISAKIGEGGMGEVYLATDTRLNREVALKILPEQFAADSQRMARFEREAQVLASLSHPNIGAIYGIEETGATRALVLELIEGPTLAEQIAQGPIPLKEALPIALQIAEALEAAHEKGIVHRDLKPANIKITPEGQVKVLDFGLAKAMEPDPDSSSPDLTQSPTLTMAATQAGMILGTAGYMSPEQARGKPVDRRADIWAFGCVFYQMLTGVGPFRDETVTDVLAAILQREPDLDQLPDDARRRFDRLFRRCLQKDMTLRLQHMGDVRLELLEEAPIELPPETSRAAFPVPIIGAALAAGLLVGVMATWSWMRAPQSLATSSATFSIRSPAPVEFVEMSPDGQTVLFRTNGRLYSRRIDDLTLQPVSGTEEATLAFFSPDSRWLGFYSNGSLRKVALDGGTSIEIARSGEPPGADWGPDGTIVFSSSFTSGLRAVSADGGPVRAVTQPDRQAGEVGHWWPHFLPDGRRVLFTIWTTSGSLNRARMAVADIATGRVQIVGEGARARYLKSGHLLFLRAGSYVIAPFDESTAALTGEPRPVPLPITKERPTGDNIIYYSVSDNGSIAYLPGDTFIEPASLVWVDRSGHTTELPFDSAALEKIRISRDGQFLATSQLGDGEFDLWLYDLERQISQQLTRQANNFDPTWRPGTRAITFGTSRAGSYDVYELDLDGDGEPVALLSHALDYAPGDWSPDGKSLLLDHWAEDTGTDVWTLTAPSGDIQPLIETSHLEMEAVFSPDGSWIAYQSTQSGRLEVYIRPSDGSGPSLRVSAEGGGPPRWARESNEIFFVRKGRMMVSKIREQDGRLDPQTPQPLFSTEDFLGEGAWDVTPDGRRLIMGRREKLYPVDEIHVILDWFEQVKGMMK